MIHPATNVYMPYVTQDSPRGRETSDIFSRLLRDRNIYLGTPIDDTVANILVAQPLHLESEDPDKRSEEHTSELQSH